MAGTANSASADQVNTVFAGFSASACTHLALSLQKFNGGLHYPDNFIGLSIDQISAVGDSAGLKARKIVPFAKDESDPDQVMCVQIGDDGSETVISFDMSDSSVSENTGMSYG